MPFHFMRNSGMLTNTFPSFFEPHARRCCTTLVWDDGTYIRNLGLFQVSFNHRAVQAGEDVDHILPGPSIYDHATIEILAEQGFGDIIGGGS